MNILILGSGGREHALAWKMAASPLTDKLYCAPGNAGIAQEAECVLLDIGDHAAVIAFCKEKKVDFVVVGPEVPLCAGIVDDLEGAGIKAFGPTKWAARLEGSKGFTKDLCKANDIPTAAYERFKSAGPAKDYVRKTGAPIVVKADGLAAGKGVVVAESVQEAEAAIDMMFGGGLGTPAWENRDRGVPRRRGGIVLCALRRRDRDPARLGAGSQARRRRRTKGPNTGGMGAYSPAPIMTEAMSKRVMDEIIHPTVRALSRAGRAVQGRALRRAHGHEGWPEADRIQRPLRRSGMPGADASHDVGPSAGADGRSRRAAQELRLALVSGRSAHRCDGGEGLPGELQQGLGHRRP
jgi:phosphoribosylamine--glycine ligase